MAKVNKQTKEIVMAWVNSYENYKTIHSFELCCFRDDTAFPLGERYAENKAKADHYYALYYRIVQSNYGNTNGYYVKEIHKRAMAHFHIADSYRVALNFYIKAKVREHNDYATKLYIDRVFKRNGITDIINDGFKNLKPINYTEFENGNYIAIEKIAAAVVAKIPFRRDNPTYTKAIEMADEIINTNLDKYNIIVN